MRTDKGLKLIVQIPCLNEEDSLPDTIKDIPRKIPGIASVEILIIDDGSTDRTVEVAKKHGVEHIVRFIRHKGLARAFSIGLDTCLRLGADIIVNTDADNQYKGDDIPNLIKPIIEKRADMVIGIRNIREHKEFSFIKKQLQKIGSWAVRKLSNTKIKDVTSGFRAYNLSAATKINVMTSYSYTLETIIQAGRTDIAIAQVPIRVNPSTRKSRLFKGMFEYIVRSILTIARIYTIYRPLQVFFTFGSIFLFPGILIGCRYIYFYLLGKGTGHVQSLILASILIILAFQMFVLGLLANLISANRFIMENVLIKEREKRHLQKSSAIPRSLEEFV